ncbi:hypothetical protein [Chryseobacterium sp. IHB B 17019]|jgi:hypothetical protein|uniref:hypothetical protein n=1 Tax=Chryseobacterium sp. IHB B 17019 TaxID=1721091 RepID=UPI000AC32F10|nr:hypothetical protein [Chryseobacterium sp. IHB B 17019]
MKKYILLIFTVFYVLVNAQGNIGNPIAGEIKPVSLPLTPEGYSLLKFDINPVDLNTGIPDISENLYSVNVDAKINIDINLKYHPSGIRVKEISGLVGQGWNITAGGAITREINGLPDDKPMFGILDNGYENALAQYGPSHNQTIKYLYNSKYGLEDVEYDVFYFNFLNHSGSFKLNKNGSGEYIGRGGNYKITYERNANDQNRVSKITIIDDAGYKYIFDKKTLDSRVINRTLIYENMHQCISYTPLEGALLPLPYVTWHLSEIQNQNSEVLCQLLYDAYTEVSPPSKAEETNIRVDNSYIADLGQDEQPMPEDADASQSCTPLFCNHRSLLPRHSSTIIQNGAALALTKINIVNKGSIEFNISNYKMQSILIKNNSGFTVKKIEFDFLSTSNGRSFLKSLLIKDKDNVQKYKYSYEYESPELLPAVTTENYDFWGYFNNKTNTDLVISGKNIISENKWADKNYVLTGTLKRIILPTGGIKEFTFESNTYSKELVNPNLVYDVAENRDPKSFHVSKQIFNGINPSNGSPITNTFIYVKDLQKMNILFAASQYQNLADISAISIQLTPIVLTPPDPSHPMLVLQGEIDSAPEDNSKSKISINLNNTTSQSVELYGNGYYRVSYHHNGNLQYNPVTYDLDVFYYNLKDNIQYLYGGGVRIKQIKVNDGNSSYSKNYNYGNPDNSKQSSGEIINTPVFTKLHNYNWSQVIGKSLAGYGIIPVSTQYLSANESGYSSVNAIRGSYVNYKNVTVSDDKGKIENVFTVYSDYSDISYDDIFNPTYRFHNQDYKIGLPITTKIYNSNNNLLKNTNNEFEIRDFTADLRSKVYDNNGGCYLQNGPWSSRISSYDAYMSNLNSQPYPSSNCGTNPMSSLLSLNSFVKYGFSGVKKNIETEAFGNNNIVTTTQNEYNNQDYLTKKTVTSPDSDIQGINYNYAHEKGNQLMIEKNIIGIPLETITTQTTNGVTKTISRAETVYPTSIPTAQAGNLVLPLSVKSYDLQNPTVSSTEVTYDKYDLKGNLQQYTTKDGISTTIIWGYNQTQPIAKIVGAKLSDLQQSMIDTIVNASNTDASAAPNNDETALLSALDSFRNNTALSGYQITTYTYDPLIGVRSITPPSGIREVYLYDTANRLMEIREGNQTGKLLKEFKYNYKN